MNKDAIDHLSTDTRARAIWWYFGVQRGPGEWELAGTDPPVKCVSFPCRYLMQHNGVCLAAEVTGVPLGKPLQPLQQPRSHYAALP